MAGAGLKLVTALVLCMLVAAPIASATVTCGQVSKQLSSCINYLQNGGPLPPVCCSGVKKFKALSRTTVDRRAACKCYQSFQVSTGHFKGSRVASLPSKCGVSIPYVLSTRTNCNNV